MFCVLALSQTPAQDFDLLIGVTSTKKSGDNPSSISLECNVNEKFHSTVTYGGTGLSNSATALIDYKIINLSSAQSNWKVNIWAGPELLTFEDEGRNNIYVGLNSSLNIKIKRLELTNSFYLASKIKALSFKASFKVFEDFKLYSRIIFAEIKNQKMTVPEIGLAVSF